MKRIVPMGAALALPALAFGGAGFSLTEGGTGVYGPTAITVNAGDSFTIDLGITQEDSTGCTLFGGALEASTSGIFYLTGRSFSLSDTCFEAVEDAVLLHDDHKWLSPQAPNFGALRFDDPMLTLPLYWPADEFPSVVCMFTLQTAVDATPGVYTIVTGDPGGGIYIADWEGQNPGQTPLTFGTIQVTVKDWPMVSTAMSYKEHGAAGEIGINVLDRTDDEDIECRSGGVTRLVVVFDMDIQRLTGDVMDVELSSSGNGDPPDPYWPDNVTKTASNELTIEMSGTTNAEPLIVTFPGIANASDVGAVCTDSVCIRQLVGDIRSDGSINVADRIDVRNAGGQAVTIDNFRCDVRADGTFNVGDRIDVRNAGGTGFVGTCP